MKIAQRSPDFVTQIGKKVLDADFGSQVQEPDRDRVVLAGAGGAAVGAALGTYLGFRAQASNHVNEVWENRRITHPVLTGYSHSAVPDYRTDCRTEGYGENKREVCTTSIEGWWHRYSPDIRHDQVGSYQAPTFRNSQWMEPLLGGFLGAVGGGLLGLGVGVGINALKRSLQDGGQKPGTISPEKREQLAQTAGAMVLGGAGLGLVGGALLGHAAGVVENSQKEIHTRTWMGPVLQNTRLGEIPADYYERSLGISWPGTGIGFGRNSKQSVYREVPLYNSDGSVRMQQVERTFDTGRYGALGGAILGGTIGAGVGLAAGVAGGTLLKMIESRRATEHSQPSP